MQNADLNTSLEEDREDEIGVLAQPIGPGSTARNAAQRRKRVSIVQVPFVAMCDAGHLQDFPWREWVHSSAAPTCEQPMRLYATGGASLAAQIVECECGAKRTLAQITAAEADRRTTYLSSNLAADRTPYLCRGMKSWLGAGATEPCASPMRGSLRSASNLYFADIRTALYLPRKTDIAPSTLVAVLEQPPLSTLVRLLSGAARRLRRRTCAVSMGKYCSHSQTINSLKA